VHVRGKDIRRIEALLCDSRPGGRVEDRRVDFAFPEDVEALSLRVILEAGETYERLVPRGGRRNDILDQVLARPHARDLPGLEVHVEVVVDSRRHLTCGTGAEGSILSADEVGIARSWKLRTT
jgi:hypothetical protein